MFLIILPPKNHLNKTLGWDGNETISSLNLRECITERPSIFFFHLTCPCESSSFPLKCCFQLKTWHSAILYFGYFKKRGNFSISVVENQSLACLSGVLLQQPSAHQFVVPFKALKHCSKLCQGSGRWKVWNLMTARNACGWTRLKEQSCSSNCSSGS